VEEEGEGDEVVAGPIAIAVDVNETADALAPGGDNPGQ